MSDTEKRLSDVEARARELEVRSAKAWEQAKQYVLQARAKIKDLELALSKSVELTQTLESQARESNEKILHLTKESEIGREFLGLVEKARPPASVGASANLKLTDVKWAVEKGEETRRVAPMDTATCRGRILKLMETGFFDQKRATAEIVEEFPRRGWPDEEKTIANTLAQLFSDSLIARERKPGDPIKYWKPEGVVFVEPEAKK